MNINLDTLPKKGELVTYKHRGASFDMKIDNARIRYGKIDVLLMPVNGTGSFWVRHDHLTNPTIETVNETAGVEVFNGQGELAK